MGNAPTAETDIRQILHDMCRLLSALVAQSDPTHIVKVLEAAWPWTRALPADDQLALAAEVGPVVEMCDSSGDWTRLLDVMADWRRTARAYDDLERGKPRN